MKTLARPVALGDGIMEKYGTDTARFQKSITKVHTMYPENLVFNIPDTSRFPHLVFELRQNVPSEFEDTGGRGERTSNGGPNAWLIAMLLLLSLVAWLGWKLLF